MYETLWIELIYKRLLYFLTANLVIEHEDYSSGKAIIFQLKQDLSPNNVVLS